MPNLTWREAIIAVLEGAREPLHYTQIAEEVAEQGLRWGLGATPAASVAAHLSLSLNNEGAESPFERVSRGMYRLSGAATERATGPGAVEAEDESEAGLINAFGMYWLRDRVLWKTPKLLGQQQQGSTTVDFSEERGVYLLHDRREVVYVGRTTEQALGTRLRQHTTGRLSGRWDRFSWFGILPVMSDGSLSDSPSESFNLENLIATMEALLIEGLEPPQNRKRGDGFSAVEFIQVVDPDILKSRQEALMDELKRRL